MNRKEMKENGISIEIERKMAATDLEQRRWHLSHEIQ